MNEELIAIINQELTQQFDVSPQIAKRLKKGGFIFFCYDCDAYHVDPRHGADNLQETWDALRIEIERLKGGTK